MSRRIAALCISVVWVLVFVVAGPAAAFDGPNGDSELGGTIMASQNPEADFTWMGSGGWYTSNIGQTWLAASIANQSTSGTSYTQKVSFLGMVKNPCGNWYDYNEKVIAGTVTPSLAQSGGYTKAIVDFSATGTLKSGCSGATVSYPVTVTGRIVGYVSGNFTYCTFTPPCAGVWFTSYGESNGQIVWGGQTTSLTVARSQSARVMAHVQTLF